MTFGEILYKLRKNRDLKQIDVAKQIGVQKNTISNYENDISKPNYDKLVQLCNLFQVNPNDLMEEDLKFVDKKEIPLDIQQLKDKYDHLTPNNKSIVDYIFGMEEEEVDLPDTTISLLDMGELISIDTYTEKVSAGNGNTTVTGHKVSKLYPTTKISSKATYAARITGDSMEPQFIEDDIIYVNDKQIPIHGDIGVFTYNGETYCKEYYAIDGVEKLISLNNSYKPIIIDKTLQFEKQGVVIGKFHAD